MKDFTELMKQAGQLQEKMRQAQEQLAKREVTGESGGGLVRVTMNGRHDVRRVHIEASLLGESRDVLEDLIAAAFNDAVRRVEATIQEKMGGMTAGLGLPPGFKMPF